MTRRTRIIFFILILLLLLGLLILYFLLSPAPDTAQENHETSDTQALEEIIPERPGVSQQELEQERETRAIASDVISLSKTFAERYGSYSHEAQFANLKDVLSLMTSDLASATLEIIQKADVPPGYYGVSTQVITVRVESQDDAAGSARVVVTTQREEARDVPQNVTVRYQDLELVFAKENGVWKVDSATWL